MEKSTYAIIISSYTAGGAAFGAGIAFLIGGAATVPLGGIGSVPAASFGAIVGGFFGLIAGMGACVVASVKSTPEKEAKKAGGKKTSEENESLREQRDAVKHENTKLNREIADLKDKDDQLQKKLEAAQKEASTLSSNNAILQAQLAQQAEALKKAQAQQLEKQAESRSQASIVQSEAKQKAAEDPFEKLIIFCTNKVKEEAKQRGGELKQTDAAIQEQIKNYYAPTSTDADESTRLHDRDEHLKIIRECANDQTPKIRTLKQMFDFVLKQLGIKQADEPTPPSSGMGMRR